MVTHAFSEATLMGHSYGTFVAGAIHKRDPTLFRKVVLLDPVAISLFKHDVAFNAVYRYVHTGRGGDCKVWDANFGLLPPIAVALVNCLSGYLKGELFPLQGPQ